MTSPLEAVSIVLAVEARQRIPDYLKDTHPFSHYAIWDYMNLGDPESECEHCLRYDGKQFTGDMLRTLFPDLEFDGDDILPRVHMTLWGKDTCKCRLIRINTSNVAPSSVVIFSGEPEK